MGGYHELVLFEFRAEVFLVLFKELLCYPFDQCCLDSTHKVKDWEGVFKGYGNVYIKVEIRN